MRLAQFRSLKGFNNTSWYNSTPTIVDDDIHNTFDYEIRKPTRKLEILKRRREESLKGKVKKSKTLHGYQWTKL